MKNRKVLEHVLMHLFSCLDYLGPNFQRFLNNCWKSRSADLSCGAWTNSLWSLGDLDCGWIFPDWFYL